MTSLLKKKKIYHLVMVYFLIKSCQKKGRDEKRLGTSGLEHRCSEKVDKQSNVVYGTWR